jgi:DNA-binding transcriptional MerR regulator
MLDNKKSYYSISEVCAKTGLESHVLRYWETEFPQLRPKKNRAGNRAYRDKDIDIIRCIKYLLYEEQFTILGAKKKCAEMKDNPHQVRLALDSERPAVDLHTIKQQLRDILQTLTEAPAPHSPPP